MTIKGIKKRKRKSFSPQRKQIITTKAITMMTEGDTLQKIATKLNITLYSLKYVLASDSRFAEYKKRQKQVLDVQFAKIAQKSLKEASKKAKTASYRDLVLSGAIAHDKIYPPDTHRIEIGDKHLNIQYPKWGKGPPKADSKAQ